MKEKEKGEGWRGGKRTGGGQGESDWLRQILKRRLKINIYYISICRKIAYMHK